MKGLIRRNNPEQNKPVLVNYSFLIVFFHFISVEYTISMITTPVKSQVEHSRAFRCVFEIATDDCIYIYKLLLLLLEKTLLTK